MKKINLIWDTLVKGGVFTSLSAVALIYSVSIILDKPIKISFLVIVFLLSIIVYLFNFIGELKEDFQYEPDEFRKIKKSRSLVWVVIWISIFLSIYLAFTLGNHLSFSFVLIFLGLGLLYTLVLKKVTYFITGFKDIFVAICWNLVIPFFIFYHGYAFSSTVYWVMAIVFTRDLVNASYCDLKDMEVDKKAGLKTFAQVLGIPKIFQFLKFGNFISVAVLLISVFLGLLPVSSLVLLIAFIITALLIHRSKIHSSFSTIAVDSEYFVWVILMLLVKYVS